MSATPPPLSLKLNPHGHLGSGLTVVLIGGYLPLSKLYGFIFKPEYRANLLSSPWELGGFVVLLLIFSFAMYCVGYLPIPASKLTLLENGVEVETRSGTRLYPWSEVRSLTHETDGLIYKVQFRNFRYVTLSHRNGDWPFMAELSALSGRPIKPSRFR